MCREAACTVLVKQLLAVSVHCCHSYSDPLQGACVPVEHETHGCIIHIQHQCFNNNVAYFVTIQ